MNQLHDLVIRLVERRVGDNSKHCSYVLKAELTSATRQVEVVASSQTDSLRKAFNSRARRSPKRRSFDFEDSETSRLATLAIVRFLCVYPSFLDSPPLQRGGKYLFQIHRH